jgi:predicted transport protein
MTVFSQTGDMLTKITETPFKLEKELQILVEKNTQAIFGIDFVKTEFELNRLRIDSLCFDKKSKAFVIIEYKKEQNYSVIDQGATYRNLLLKNPAEFILLCNEAYDKNLKKSDVNWDKTKVIFVSPEFTENQRTALEESEKPTELWTVKRYSNKIIVFDQIQSEKRSSSNQINISACSEDIHLEKADDDIKTLYVKLKNKILSTFHDVVVEPKQTYIAFKHRVNFVDVIVQKSNLKLVINMKKGTLDDPKNLVRDISVLQGHFGNGDYEIQIKDNSDLDYVLGLVGQSFAKN